MMRTRRSLAGFPPHQAQNKGGPGPLGCSKYSLQHAPANCLTLSAFICRRENRSVDAGIGHTKEFSHVSMLGEVVDKSLSSADVFKP